MISIEEFKDEFKIAGSEGLIVKLQKSAIEKFVEWQKEIIKKHKSAKVLSVQKIKDGVFVVWEK